MESGGTGPLEHGERVYMEVERLGLIPISCLLGTKLQRDDLTNAQQKALQDLQSILDELLGRLDSFLEGANGNIVSTCVVEIAGRLLGGTDLCVLNNIVN